MVLTGEGLSAFSGTSAGRDSRYVFFDGTRLVDGHVQRLEGRELALTLDPALRPDAMYLLWARNANGYGRPVAINRAEAWWVGRAKRKTGETFSVYGRNLGTDVYAYIDGHGWLASSFCNPYKADFVVPAGLGNGKHSVWLHNGNGGRYGWSDAVELEVWNGYSYSENQSSWYNVEDYGADGSDSRDDRAAILAALDAADNSAGNTVYFPAGRYLLSAETVIQGSHPVRFVGAGAAAATISSLNDLPSSGLKVKRDGTIFRDIGFSTGDYDMNKGIVWVENADDLVFEDCLFTARETRNVEPLFRIIDARRVLIEGCRFEVSSAMWFETTFDVEIKDCDFRGINDCNVLLGLSCLGFSMHGCTAAPYSEADPSDGAGWGKGRWISGSNKGCANMYLGDNTTTNMRPRIATPKFNSAITSYQLLGDDPSQEDPRWLLMKVGVPDMPKNLIKYVDMKMNVTHGTDNHVGYWVRSIDPANGTAICAIEDWRAFPKDTTTARADFVDWPDPNSGEQFMFEGGHTEYRGEVLSAGPDSATFADASSYYSRFGNSMAYGMVCQGKGLGQCRKVTGISGNTILFDKPWNVEPDGTSVILFGKQGVQWAVYNNFLDSIDTPSYSASSGFQLTGGGHSVVVDGNTMHETRTGISNYAEMFQNYDGSINTASPQYFGLYRNNHLINNQRGIVSAVYYHRSAYPDPYADVSMLGNVWRANRLEGSAVSAVSCSSVASKHLAMTVFDANTASGFGESVQANSGVRGHVWVGNTFTGDGGGTGMAIASGHVPALQGNRWEQFSSAYGGDLPGGVLELPLRIKQVSSEQQATIKVCNSGTDRLAWTASADASWLEVGQTSGVVADEHASDSIPVALKSGAQPAEGSVAVVTVMSGDQVKQVSVMYEAASTLPPPPEPPPAPVLSSIEVSGPANVNEGSTAQYVCTAHYSDGTTETVSATWSENISSASINSLGVLTAGDVSSDQSLTVTASFGGKTDAHAVTIKYVEPVLTGITISGPAQITEEATGQYTCTASYSDGSSTVVSPIWSENSSSASINGSGVLTAGDVTSDQSVTVSASYGGEVDSYAVTIKYIEPLLVNIVVSGPTSLNEGTAAQYTCTATYSDGTSATVVPSWSENSAFAAINGSGVLTTENISADESVIITATYGGKSDTHSATIKYVEPVLTDIAISGPSGVVEESSAQYFCTATYSDGTSASVVPQWSQNSGHASINTSGFLVVGDISSDQYLTITASFGGMTDAYSVSLAYVPPALTGIAISGPTSLDENSGGQFACTAHYADGTSASVVPSWSVSSSSMAISASGWLTVGNVGSDETATVSASFDGQLASKSLNVVAIGTEITFPLSGFVGKTIRAELWDDLSKESRFYDPAVAPDELVLTDVEPDRWYWLVIEEYDESSNEWVQTHANWINM